MPRKGARDGGSSGGGKVSKGQRRRLAAEAAHARGDGGGGLESDATIGDGAAPSPRASNASTRRATRAAANEAALRAPGEAAAEEWLERGRDALVAVAAALGSGGGAASKSGIDGGGGGGGGGDAIGRAGGAAKAKARAKKARAKAKARSHALSTTSDVMGVRFSGRQFQELYYSTKYVRRGLLLYNFFHRAFTSMAPPAAVLEGGLSPAAAGVAAGAGAGSTGSVSLILPTVFAGSASAAMHMIPAPPLPPARSELSTLLRRRLTHAGTGQQTLTVVSIGGGPGTDAAGIVLANAAYLGFVPGRWAEGGAPIASRKEKRHHALAASSGTSVASDGADGDAPLSIRLLLLDFEPQWRAYTATLASIFGPHNVNGEFGTCDVRCGVPPARRGAADCAVTLPDALGPPAPPEARAPVGAPETRAGIVLAPTIGVAGIGATGRRTAGSPPDVGPGAADTEVAHSADTNATSYDGAHATNWRVRDAAADAQLFIFAYVLHETSAASAERGWPFYASLACACRDGAVFLFTDVQGHSMDAFAAVQAAMCVAVAERWPRGSPGARVVTRVALPASVSAMKADVAVLVVTVIAATSSESGRPL